MGFLHASRGGRHQSACCSPGSEETYKTTSKQQNNTNNSSSLGNGSLASDPRPLNLGFLNDSLYLSGSTAAVRSGRMVKKTCL